jgi:hypothetical protein
MSLKGDLRVTQVTDVRSLPASVKVIRYRYLKELFELLN